MTETILDLADCQATERLGLAVAKLLKPGQVVFLEGELGAGKTTLVRAILQGMGWTGPVRSPSYSLIHTYPTLHPAIHHLDLYRLGSAEEAMGLDLDHLLQDGPCLLVEWADRLEGCIPSDFTVALEVTGPQSRRARIIEPADAYIGALITAQGANPK